MALENELGLMNLADLAREERHIRKKKVLERLKTGCLILSRQAPLLGSRRSISISLASFATLPTSFARSTSLRGTSALLRLCIWRKPLRILINVPVHI